MMFIQASSAAFCRWMTCVATAALLIAACSGGGGDELSGVGSGGSGLAGVGSGGSGIASGLVSGFGSVIVDGIEYDDRNATRQAQDASGTLVNTALKLGQRVRVVYSSSNVAQSIEVQPQLLGPVTSSPSADGMLEVMGQKVRTVTESINSSQSTPTVLSGYAVAGDVRAGDDVEVHGSWVYESALAANVLVATRIEKQSSTADPVQLGGVVTQVTSNSLRLNSAGGLLVTSASLPSLVPGDTVRLWAARSALASSPMPATRVAVAGVSLADVAAVGRASISGLASNYDAVSRTLTINGSRIKLADGLNVDEAALARGEFAVAQISLSGSSMVATAVALRSGASGADLGKTVVVNSVTRNIDWNAVPVTFSLRGTPIQADAAVIAGSCRMMSPMNDTAVEVIATLKGAAAVLTASAVRCSPPSSGSMTMDLSGTIGSIDSSAGTLTVTMNTTSGALVASWDSTTYFSQRPESLLPGLRVEVEGIMNSGSKILRLIRVTVVQ